MANVTYLLGAGASAGKRTESGYIMEGLPCVNEINSSLLNIIRILNDYLIPDDINCIPELGLNSKEDWEINRKDLLSLFSELQSNISNHATIDTYAKKLKLQGRLNEFSVLEQLLSLFFIYEQIIRTPDSRYDTFLANILNNNSALPKNIKIISWNYDSQIEIAYSEYNSNLDNLNIGSKTYKDYQEWNILKLNGTANFYKHERELIEIRKEVLNEIAKIRSTLNDKSKISEKEGQLKLKKFLMLYKSYMHEKTNNTDLSFAFDYTSHSEAILQRSHEIINDTDALVIIGYTFPFFNREIDRKVLSRLSPRAKVYIQDLALEKIKESFKAVLPNFNDNNISLIRDVTQFYLPPEL